MEKFREEFFEKNDVHSQENSRKVHLDFIKDLIDNRERFQYIFETEKGSIYFVLHSGETMRIKKHKPGIWPGDYQIQNFTKRIFFIDASEENRLKAMILEDNKKENINKLVGKKIFLTELREGVIPIEVDVVDLWEDEEHGRRAIFEFRDNKIVFKGDKIGGSINEKSIGLVHFGHPIFKIIKQ